MNNHQYKGSPWGHVQYQHTVIEGIVSVGTASHGGLKLSAKRQALMPDYLRTTDGWYEEDCEWARVYVVFGCEISKYYQQHPEEPEAKFVLGNLSSAPESLKNWCPDGYEKFFSEVIPAGKSYIREHPLPDRLRIQR